MAFKLHVLQSLNCFAVLAYLHIYMIMCFPPSGYQHRRADNRKSCVLNGERLSCPHATLSRDNIVTLSEMTLRHFIGDAFFFYTLIDNFSHFYQNMLNRRFLRCDKQIITFWSSPFVSTLDHYQPSS